jgi:hypothetical protein
LNAEYPEGSSNGQHVRRPPSSSPEPEVLDGPQLEEDIQEQGNHKVWVCSPSVEMIAPVTAAPKLGRAELAQTPRSVGLDAVEVPLDVPRYVTDVFLNGWKEHIPLTLLTDEHLRSYATKVRTGADTSFRLDPTTGTFVVASKLFDREAELEKTISMAEWSQALGMVQLDKDLCRSRVSPRSKEEMCGAQIRAGALLIV